MYLNTVYQYSPLGSHVTALLRAKVQIELHAQALLAFMTINKPQSMQLLTGIPVLQSTT